MGMVSQLGEAVILDPAAVARGVTILCQVKLSSQRRLVCAQKDLDRR